MPINVKYLVRQLPSNRADSAATLNSDNPQASNIENCYRYVIHLNPPQSFGGKWVNEE